MRTRRARLDSVHQRRPRSADHRHVNPGYSGAAGETGTIDGQQVWLHGGPAETDRTATDCHRLAID